MRSAAKVFLILGIVFLFWLIFPIIIGALCIQKLNDPKTSKDELTTWGIIAIFTVSFLGGLFMLLLPLEEKNDGVVDVESTPKPDPSTSKETETNSYEYIEKIKELKELYDSGAISEEEFIELKARLLNK